MPALVSWTGDADDGLWSTAKNWNNNAVPTSNDDVMIDVPGEQTVTINAGNVTVRSITSFENLTVNGSASLTLTSGFSTVDAMFQVANNRRFHAQGPTTRFICYGQTTVDGATIWATQGARILLPGVTAYDGLDASFPELRAEGLGSELVLANMTALEGTTFGGGGGSRLTIQASGGGRITMPAVTSVPAAGFVRLNANGANSKIDMSSLTSFTPTAGLSYIDALNSGAIVCPLLTQIAGTVVTLDGKGTFDTGKLDSLVSSTMTVGGKGYNLSLLTTLSSSTLDLSQVSDQAFDLSSLKTVTRSTLGVATVSYSLPNVTSINGSSLFVTGGAKLTLPGVAAYDGLDASFPELRTEGLGSELVLANMTALEGTTFGGSGGSRLTIQALGGGRVTMPAVTSVPAAGFVRLNANGANSKIDMSSLTSFTPTAGLSYIDALNSGAIVCPLL
ncbi:MAG: G8 domain-containing protein, partial [Gemmataceae bacterium]|nr:G8 domain-containing protein [Gemmataceae bacterium]